MVEHDASPCHKACLARTRQDKAAAAGDVIVRQKHANTSGTFVQICKFGARKEDSEDGSATARV